MAQELFKLVGKIVIDSDQAKQDIDSTTSQAESSSSRIMSSFQKIGGVVAGAMAVDKIVDFGRTCVENAATVQAQNAQFEATFGDLQKAATEAFDRVGQSTGILSTRLQTEGTKAFSMFKGAGMDANTALKETETFMSLAADAAAYYDISLEEASERVLGFAKGNFENGDAIGVFTNEAQRNTVAMDKYGKKFSECTEAQKQMLALDMIGETYKLSGALGQATREADGYENVMGNLKEAWRQFTAIIGAPVLQALIPILKSLTSGLSTLGTKAQEIGQWIGQLWDNFKKSDQAKQSMEQIQNVINNLKAAWDIIFPSLQNVWNSVWTTIQMVWNTVGQPIFNYINTTVQTVVGWIVSNFPTIAQVVSNVFNTISMIWNTILLPVFTTIMTVVGTLINVFTPVFNTILNVVGTCFTGIMNFWNNILFPVIQTIISVIGGLVSTFTTVFNTILSIVGNTWSSIASITSTILNGIMSVISTVWNTISSIIGTVLNTILSVVSSVWNTISSTVSTVCNTIKGVVSTAWNTISSTVSNVVNTIKNTVSNAFNTIKTIATNVWNGVKDAIATPMNAAKDLVGGIIDTIKGFFNFKISWPHIPMPHFSIKPSGWSIGDLLKGSIPSLGIDWYAEGGILEEPTAFGVSPNGNLRVGGEAGKEAVAPIDTLMGYVRDAVRAENGNVESLLKKILRAILAQSDMAVVMDNGALVGQLAPSMDVELGKIQGRKRRR
jgi:phage-related protein